MDFLLLLPMTILLLFLMGMLRVSLGTKPKRGPDYRNLPPGSSGWPVFGETLDFLRAYSEGNPLKFARDRVEKYNSLVFRTHLLGENMVMLCGPAGNKFLFSNEGKKVALWWHSSLRRLIGPALVNKAGDEGLIQRKLLMKFFNMESLMKCIPTMDEVTQHHLTTHWQGKKEVKVYPTITRYTFELACRLFMSISEPELMGKISSLFHHYQKGIISIPLNLPGTRFYAGMRAADAIRRELRVLVRQRRVDLENKVASPTQDLMSYLLSYPDENGKFMPEVEIINNMLSLLFAGHDTSTSTITMVMKYLAELPRVYDKVIAEQREIAASKEQGELLKWEDLQRMRYSKNVLAEVMRMTPPGDSSYREALVDIAFEGYTIPKGWKITWSASFTHYDPNCHPKATEFDESRFEEGSGPPPFSYVPFGGGPRMCLGKEFARLNILIFMHYLANGFDWELSIPNEKVIYDPMPTPVNGLPVRLRPRSL